MSAGQAMLATLGAAKGTDCQLPQHICFVCGESKTKDGAALMVCGNCGSARYCSRECQKQAWKEHKKFCNFIKQGKELKEKAKQVSALWAIPKLASQLRSPTDNVL